MCLIREVGTQVRGKWIPEYSHILLVVLAGRDLWVAKAFAWAASSLRKTGGKVAPTGPLIRRLSAMLPEETHGQCWELSNRLGFCAVKAYPSLQLSTRLLRLNFRVRM